MTALLAEFKDPDSLLAAVGEARRRRLVVVDAFTPFPLSGLAEAMGLSDQRINWLGFAGMAVGALFGWFIQWYPNIDYSLNVGGRPLIAPPAFTVLSFEFAVFGGALFMVGGLLALNRLPRLHHPIFAAPRFHLASRDRFFLLLDAPDEAARRAVDQLGPVTVSPVDWPEAAA